MLKPNFNWLKWRKIIWLLVSTILKNDGVRQWEGWHPIYEMENKSNVWNPTSTLIVEIPNSPWKSELTHQHPAPLRAIQGRLQRGWFTVISVQRIYFSENWVPPRFLSLTWLTSQCWSSLPPLFHGYFAWYIYIYTYNVRPPSYKLVYKPQ
jgi:hypothetical protein